MSGEPRDRQGGMPVFQAVQDIAAAALPERATTRAPEVEMSALVYARSIVDTLREPLLVLDGALRVRTASRSFYNMFGVSREQAEGRLVYDLGNGEWNIPALRALLQEVLTEKKDFHDYEVCHNFPVLGHRVMLLNARQLWAEAAETNSILLAIEDITERRRIADELVRSNEDLQRFAYVAAHDLRSPLNAALHLSQLLARRVKARLNENEWEMLQNSIESMERLGKLMNDVLAYSETGNVPQQCTLVWLDEPLRIALANLQHHVEESGATVTVRDLPSVETDRTQTAMLFQNLIGNAIKYRRDDRPLRVSIEAVQVGTHCRVSVADNGQGFEAEHAAYIFEPFKRLHREEIKGSGIGLATCKRIVERWGGRIWAESVPGQGSTFFFTIPGASDRLPSSSTAIS